MYFLHCLQVILVSAAMSIGKNDKCKQAASLIVLFLSTLFVMADYSFSGFALILLLYVLRDKKVIQAIAAGGILSNVPVILAAFIPINMYNGKRGFIRGKAAKYIFYAAYPLHMIILYLIKLSVFGY